MRASLWLSKSARFIERVASSVSTRVGSVGLAVLAVMMVFTTVDVILRYFFQRPILGSLELTEFMMVIAVFAGIAYTQVKKGHIGVDILVSRLPQRAQTIIESITLLMGVVLFALMAWQGALQMEKYRLGGQTSATLGLPVYPFVLAVSIGSALLCLVLLSNLLSSLVRLVERNRWDVLIWLAFGGALSTSPLWVHWLPWQVSPTMAGFISFGVLLLLLFSGMPIAFSALFLGVIGMAYLSSTQAGLALMMRVPYMESASYTYAVLPMFAIMGTFAFHSGLTRDLYNTVDKWLGYLPGGLAIATIGASAGFAAVCGSSLASTATMGTIALPEMKRHNYDTALACGCIVAGGTLGPLIPPSTILIVYGLLARQPIGALFIAGILPGLLLTFMYMITIYVRARYNIKLGPPGHKTSLIEKLASLKGTWSTVVLFGLVMGGIYFGIFTPTEAAGIGAFGALALMLSKRRLNWRTFTTSLDDTLRLNAMAMLMIIGAIIMGYFLSVTRLPFHLATFVSGLDVSPYIIFAGIVLMYVALGFVMSAFPLVIITIPILLPSILALGFDPIWFGVIVVLVVEMGCITPPVAMNVFVLHALAPDIPLSTMFRGIWWFFACMLILVVILTAFPQIALFLTTFMK